MNAQVYVTLAGFGLALLVQLVGCVVWCIRLEGRLNMIGGTTDNRLNALEKAAEAHAELRDIVIEMRADMRSVVGSIKELGEAMRAHQSNNRRPSA